MAQGDVENGAHATTVAAGERPRGNHRLDSPFADYPKARPLLISASRPRAFLERTARELLAGGEEALVFLAMGEAILTCIVLTLALVEKKAVKIVRIVTERNSYYSRAHTPSLRILVVRHPEFKGSRTPPAYVQFAPSEGEEISPLDARARVAYVVAGNESFSFTAPGCDQNVVAALTNCGIELSEIETFMQQCYKVCVQRHAQGGKEGSARGDSMANSRALIFENPGALNPNIKAAMCRLGVNESKPHIGAALLAVIQPVNTTQKVFVVYVVCPERRSYNTEEEYLENVKLASLNLMVLLCDYNGLVQREGPHRRLKRVPLCRVSMLSEGSEGVSKNQLAKAIIQGMDQGYRHGPSPRVVFAGDPDVFRKMWTEVTGLEPVKPAGPRRSDQGEM